MKAWIFRFANIVGKNGTHGVIVDFIKKLEKNDKKLLILGNGKQAKPYLHVNDCVEGMIHGWKNSSDKINCFNLGCKDTTAVNEIANMVVNEMGFKNVKFEYTGGERGWIGDVPQVNLDMIKMSKIGWKAKLSSNQAVRKAVKEILKTS